MTDRKTAKKATIQSAYVRNIDCSPSQMSDEQLDGCIEYALLTQYLGTDTLSAAEFDRHIKEWEEHNQPLFDERDLRRASLTSDQADALGYTH